MDVNLKTKNPPVYAFDFKSSNRYSSKDLEQPPYECKFDPKNDSLISYYSIEGLVVENKIKNVNEYNKNVSINGTTYTMTEGYYETVADFLTHFNATIAASGVSAAVNTTTKLITISGGGVFSITTQNINNGKTLLDMMGFKNQIILQGSATYTATRLPRAQYTTYLTITSRNLSQFTTIFTSSKGSGSNIITRMYCADKPPGDGALLFSRGSESVIKWKYEKTKTFGSLDLTIFDEFNNKLTPLDGEWYLDLLTYSPSYEEVLFNQ